MTTRMHDWRDDAFRAGGRAWVAGMAFTCEGCGMQRREVAPGIASTREVVHGERLAIYFRGAESRNGGGVFGSEGTVSGTMTNAELLKRHQELHARLDELIACFIQSTGKRPSQVTVMELIEWSHRATFDERACGHREGKAS